MSRTPTAVWAQRKNDVFVTVNISNATDVVVDIAAQKVHVVGKAEGELYSIDLPLAYEVVPSVRFLSFKKSMNI